MGEGTVWLPGLLMPALAAAGWLWWIYQSDKYEREPWDLVLKTAALGALFGLFSLFLRHFLLEWGLPGTLALIPVHMAAIMLAMLLLPYRDANWNEPFDGLVYGGAAGIGYGLVYTISPLFYDVSLGFRLAAFSIPVYMLIGLILGNYMSQIKFGPARARVGFWLRGVSRAGLFLIGFDLAIAAGGELVGGENLLAGLVAYGANMIGWIFAVRAMEESHSRSPFNPDRHRLVLSNQPCVHCGGSYPEGAGYCNSCGEPVRTAVEV